MTSRFVSRALAFGLWIGCVIGLIIVLVCCISGKPERAPLIGQMLDPVAYKSLHAQKGSETVKEVASPTPMAEVIVPYSILLLLGWILIELALHYGRLRNEARGTKEFITAIEIADAESQKRALESLAAENGRTARRAGLMVKYDSSFETLQDALPNASSLDSSSLDSSYGSLRLYIWILPVLGFIGTALGMSDAIIGFKDAVSSGDLAPLMRALGERVIPGLAGAFGTTIIALFAAIVGHFCATVLQAWEQDDLETLDRACQRSLNERQRNRKVDSRTVPPSVDMDRLLEAADELQQSARAFRSALQRAIKATGSSATIRDEQETN